MASEVDICNLALTHFGQGASIDAIDPPDGSAEADYCARFYPIARDEMLERQVFTFSTKRATLAELTNDRPDWQHRYALPADCLKPRAVLPATYSRFDSLEELITSTGAFEWEAGSIYTDEADAVLVYTFRLTDTTKFSPLFVTSASYILAGYLAGPIAKDPTGRTQLALRQLGDRYLTMAAASNANATRNRTAYVPTAKRAR
mgnify:CR=1 FL=1